MLHRIQQHCAPIDHCIVVVVYQMQRFKSGLDKDSLFHPTLQDTLKQLEAFQLEPVVIQSIQSICGTCQGALDQLVFSKRELVSGKQKEELVEWWLNTITQAVELFLANLYVSESVRESVCVRVCVCACVCLHHIDWLATEATILKQFPITTSNKHQATWNWSKSTKPFLPRSLTHYMTSTVYARERERERH
jgi:hypothetical protein